MILLSGDVNVAPRRPQVADSLAHKLLVVLAALGMQQHPAGHIENAHEQARLLADDTHVRERVAHHLHTLRVDHAQIEAGAGALESQASKRVAWHTPGGRQLLHVELNARVFGDAHVAERQRAHVQQVHLLGVEVDATRLLDAHVAERARMHHQLLDKLHVDVEARASAHPHVRQRVLFELDQMGRLDVDDELTVGERPLAAAAAVAAIIGSNKSFTRHLSSSSSSPQIEDSWRVVVAGKAHRERLEYAEDEASARVQHAHGVEAASHEDHLGGVGKVEDERAVGGERGVRQRLRLESHQRVVLEGDLDVSVDGRVHVGERVCADRAVEQLVDDDVREAVGREAEVSERVGPKLSYLIEVNLRPVHALVAALDQLVAVDRVVAARAARRARFLQLLLLLLLHLVLVSCGRSDCQAFWAATHERRGPRRHRHH